MNIPRRDFIKRLGGASGVTLLRRTLALGRGRVTGQSALSDQALPTASESGIQHIVVVTMENRSFDHFLGWLPNANAQQNFGYPTPNGGTQNTRPPEPRQFVHRRPH